MNDLPSVANVVAQVAISGDVQGGTTTAAESDVVAGIIQLGVSKNDAERAVQRAVDTKVVTRSATGKHLAIAAI